MPPKKSNKVHPDPVSIVDTSKLLKVLNSDAMKQKRTESLMADAALLTLRGDNSWLNRSATQRLDASGHGHRRIFEKKLGKLMDEDEKNKQTMKYIMTHPLIKEKRITTLIQDGIKRLSSVDIGPTLPIVARKVWQSSLTDAQKQGIYTSAATQRAARGHVPLVFEEGNVFIAQPVQHLSKGGLIKKTSLAKLHKGEIVIPAKRVEAVKKAVKAAGLKALRA